jgi:hypothetical protein
MGSLIGALCRLGRRVVRWERGRGFGSSRGCHGPIVGLNFLRMNVDAGKACVCKGHPSSSSWMGLSEEMDVEIRFPDQISGPPVGWRSARSRVAMLRAITDLHPGVLSLRVWKAISMGQWRNLEDACCSEARAVPPRAPASFRSFVQERTDAPQ